ncbi:hypothetical protein KP78_00620 [Jeotgalibacillus soli]|uniref:Uncharacterized protein n=1 Tax=Jeotgalibacillus soli TaxID=889306 RepID=A0A0C2VUF2_9BACL|nr:hypothetical protein KP78_00620 [Jeotgalibacillus soli]
MIREQAALFLNIVDHINASRNVHGPASVFFFVCMEMMKFHCLMDKVDVDRDEDK